MALSPDFVLFCQRWQDKANLYRGVEVADWFDKFFTLWVLFNALYTEVAWRTGNEGIADDVAGQDNLLHYLGARAFIEELRRDRDVVEALTQIQTFLHDHVYYFKLDRKTGARQPKEDERLLNDFRSNGTNGQGKAILEALYSIRCNLFHGHKAFDPGQVDLLRPITVILKSVIDVRTHSNGHAVRIHRFTESGRDFFMAEIGAIVHVVGRHTTEAAAQAEADLIMREAGRSCSDACLPWTPIAN